MICFSSRIYVSLILELTSFRPDSMAAKTGGAVQVHKNDTGKRTAMARRGFGREGKPIRLLSNHFAVKLSGIDAVFYQYSVMQNSQFCICYSFLTYLIIIVLCLF